MAQMWFLESCEDGGAGPAAPEWAPFPLEAAACRILDGRPVRAPATRGCRAASALLLRGQGDTEAWLLVGPETSRVNGLPLLAGIRILQDRDELLLGGRRAFFSGERLAVVEPFPGADRPIFCPRCKQVLQPHSPAVQCPQCRVWHHSGELQCWAYTNRCALCDQPTDLSAGFRWTPEGL